jgi:hypothetical protein
MQGSAVRKENAELAEGAEEMQRRVAVPGGLGSFVPGEAFLMHTIASCSAAGPDGVPADRTPSIFPGPGGAKDYSRRPARLGSTPIGRTGFENERKRTVNGPA